LVLLGTQVFSVAYLSDRLAKLESQPSIDDAVKAAVVQAQKDSDTRRSQLKLADLRESAKNAPEYNDEGLLYGHPDARFSISVFTDIECPYCRQMHGELKRVVESSNGAVNWKIIHFPLGIHNPAAAIEAQALECVKESYGNRTAWAFLDAMIEDTQGNGKGIDNLPDFGREMGLSGSAIQNCLNSDAHKDTINAGYQRGVNAGITGTPAMIINDNSTGRSSLVKQMQNAQTIVQEIQKLL
tara:strand:- start:17958 stop:18680 length:723 start_codon:yes stop_codon:yes gene_type:complete